MPHFRTILALSQIFRPRGRGCRGASFFYATSCAPTTQYPYSEEQGKWRS